MKWVISVVAVIAVLGVALHLFAGNKFKARVDTAADNAVKKLDDLLGSLDVKRKEIDLDMHSLKEAANGINKAKIKAQVKQDQIDTKAQPIRDKIAQSDTTLKKLRDYLATGQSVDIAGKNYAPSELKTMADQVIQARKNYASQVASFEQSQTELKKVITSLEKKQQELEGQITRLESQIAQIDAQMVAVKAMKDASATMGDSGATLSENVKKHEDKVADLMADTKVELGAESRKWDSAAIDKKIDTADEFIKATQEPKDTLAEIDKILGEKK